MAQKPTYVCASCGTTYSKWAGRCDGCGEWNTIAEGTPLSSGPKGKGLGAEKGALVPLTGLNEAGPEEPRTMSGIAEFDRVLGGGLVPASVTLVGGDPGIGKSTLLLQVASKLAKTGAKTIYASGEEATRQISMRAGRLGLADAPVALAAETNLRNILTTLEAERPVVAIIDSIQTMWSDRVESAPGSVAQVRACAHELTTFAKRFGVAIILVGHVTKEGQIAGPRVVEHMVDTVIYFEGERGHQYRILRAVKNRFGPADEIGVFEMTGAGLAEVLNPSFLSLSEREAAAPGSVVFAGIEGTRAMFVEIQALVARSSLGTPRRSVVGWDSARLAMVLAVLEARAGIALGGHDVYLNVAGGLKIALVSALQDMPLPAQTALFGEISLSGALRPAIHADTRLKEAQKLGFSHVHLPKHAKNRFKTTDITLMHHEHLTPFMSQCFGRADFTKEPDAT